MTAKNPEPSESTENSRLSGISTGMRASDVYSLTGTARTARLAIRFRRNESRLPLRPEQLMSAFGGKADIADQLPNVCF